MQKSDMRIGAHHRLTVELQHHTQHTVSSWMLWTKVDTQVAHLLLGRWIHLRVECERILFPIVIVRIGIEDGLVLSFEPLLVGIPFVASVSLLTAIDTNKFPIWHHQNKEWKLCNAANDGRNCEIWFNFTWHCSRRPSSAATTSTSWCRPLCVQHLTTTNSCWLQMFIVLFYSWARQYFFRSNFEGTIIRWSFPVNFCRFSANLPEIPGTTIRSCCVWERVESK